MRILFPSVLAVVGPTIACQQSPVSSRDKVLAGSSASPLVVSHRGASALAPENTLAAIVKALEIGADAVEVDLRLSADGEVVLFHDDDLDRTTDGTGPMGTRTLAELAALDAGSWWGSAFTGEPIPTLDAAFHATRGRARLMLDLKVPGCGAAIARGIGRTGFDRADVVVGAWDDEQLADAMEHLGGCELLFIGEVPANAGGDWVRSLAAKGYDALSLNWTGVTPAVLDAAADREMPVYVWTLNDPAEFRAAAAAGVSGIITDDPGLLRSTLFQSESASARCAQNAGREGIEAL